MTEQDDNGYRVKYGVEEHVLDTTERSDCSVGDMTSTHGLVEKKENIEIKNRALPEKEWPTPENAGPMSANDEHAQDDEGIIGCLCYGFVCLGDLLCKMYSEGDQQKEVHFSRAPMTFGSKLQSASRLLTAQMASELYHMLPETSRLSTPVVSFATYRDGWSMTNLLAKTKDLDPVVVLVRALKSKTVIGAFSTARLSPPSTRVRGNGECFVFRLTDPATAYRWTYIPSMNKSSQNQFLVSCMEYIAFGGSAQEATNALRIDGDLRTCDSGCSDTYQSEPLAPEEIPPGGVPGPFQVGDIEVLHVADSRRRRGRRSGF